MDFLTTLLILFGLLWAVIIYQSRHETFSFAVYVRRFVHLLTIIYQYCRDVSLYMAKQFRQIDWNIVDK